MKTFCKWMAVVVTIAGLFSPAQAAPNKHPDGNRFLFVVETSSSSSRLEHGGRQAAFDLIYTGVNGQMHAGDTFGLWTFNELVLAGVYPMQTWTPENMELATSAGQFLKLQRYHKKGQLANVLKQVMSLVRSVKDVNVFIVSNPATRPDEAGLGASY